VTLYSRHVLYYASRAILVKDLSILTYSRLQSFRPSPCRDAGCTCPPEFYGPHCEFLHINGLEDISPSSNNRFSLAGFLLGGALILTSAVTVLVFRRRYYRANPMSCDDNVSYSDSHVSGLDEMELDHGDGQWMVDTGVPIGSTEDLDRYSDKAPPDTSVIMKHFPKHFPPTPSEMI
jgi:hypothetical protein